MSIKNAGRGTPKYNEGMIVDGNIHNQDETLECKGTLMVSGSISSYTFPSDDGLPGQMMYTDGLGTVSWTDKDVQALYTVPAVVAPAKVDGQHDASPWEFIVCDAYNNDVIVRLPQASQAMDAQICVKSAGPMNGNEIRIVTYMSMGSIDGQTQQVLTGDWDSMTIISNGSSWFII